MTNKACFINLSHLKYNKIGYKKTKYRISIRHSPEYKAWRKKVLIRDKYTCQNCGSKKRRLEVHHIRGFTKYQHLRLKVKNGITLCARCHNKFHKDYGKTNFPNIVLVWNINNKEKYIQ
jgi:5-methylcytosine-specific restriction endonuclease McrA